LIATIRPSFRRPALKDLSKTATPHELQQLIPVITVLQLTRTSRGQILLNSKKVA
jgi:hypothetical protein